MPDNGIRSTDLDTLSLADDLIANRDGNIGRMPVKSLAAPGLIVPLVYDTPAAAIASTEGERGPGRQWATREGLAYEELPASADPEDYDFLTPGGARLRVLTSGGELHLDSFGADPSGVAFSTMAFRAWLAAGERRGGGPMRASGLYVLGDPGDPATDDEAPACFAYNVPKTGRDSEFLLEGATFHFTEADEKWGWRIYQQGNSANWKVPKIKGGTFDMTGVTRPKGMLLWDDIGDGIIDGAAFNRVQRDDGTSAICIGQRNYSSWSENNNLKNLRMSQCDRLVEGMIYTGPGSTATLSMARTKIDGVFAAGTKSWLIVNRAGMYDSIISDVKGNAQKTGVFLNIGGAVANSKIKDVRFEQGYEGTVRTSGIMDAGSNVLTLDGETQFGAWMAEDAGMRVRVSGAGAGGADLETWITGFTSASEVTLAHPAALAVTGATVTTYSTVCYEDRSSLHQWKYSDLSHRNNGRVFDDTRFTGADTSRRPTTFGAVTAVDIHASGVMSADKGTFGGTQLRMGTVILDAADTSVWATAYEADGTPLSGNRGLMELFVKDSTAMVGRWRLAQAGDFGTKTGTYVNGDRDTGVYPEVLETRVNGAVLQIRSPTDTAALRGRTLSVRMHKV